MLSQVSRLMAAASLLALAVLGVAGVPGAARAQVDAAQFAKAIEGTTKLGEGVVTVEVAVEQVGDLVAGAALTGDRQPGEERQRLASLQSYRFAVDLCAGRSEQAERQGGHWSAVYPGLCHRDMDASRQSIPRRA